MPISLTTARTRLRRVVDDSDANPLFSDTALDDALRTAQYETTQLVVGAGSNLFNVEAAKTSSSTGAVDMATEAPLKIIYVQLTQGNMRLQVQPARSTDWLGKVLAPQALIVGYVARPTFPPTAGDTFQWGSATVDAPLLDDLMIVLAAISLRLQVEDGPSPALLAREERLREAAINSLNIPSWTVTPLSQATLYPTGRYAGFQWVMTSRDAMQLVFA
jgi:hypothetical protein